MNQPRPLDTPVAMAQSDGIGLAILSRAGGRTYNEDACGHWHSDQHLCCVLADGAGGHGGGDVAAKLAVVHMIGQFSAAPLSQQGEVRELLQETNGVVISHREDAPAQANMHTTVVSLFIDFQTDQAVWGHAGDSRLYVFRQGQLRQRTVDHSLVQSLVDAGMLQPHEVACHPRRSELLSALGVEPGDLSIGTSVEPWGVQTGDAFLLCSDGLWEYVSDDQLCASLSEASSPTDWLARLEQQVLAQAATLHKSTHDNYSGIAVWIGSPASGAGA